MRQTSAVVVAAIVSMVAFSCGGMHEPSDPGVSDASVGEVLSDVQGDASGESKNPPGCPSTRPIPDTPCPEAGLVCEERCSWRAYCDKTIKLWAVSSGGCDY